MGLATDGRIDAMLIFKFASEFACIKYDVPAERKRAITLTLISARRTLRCRRALAGALR